jgi:hypothetical protein
VVMQTRCDCCMPSKRDKFLRVPRRQLLQVPTATAQSWYASGSMQHSQSCEYMQLCALAVPNSSNAHLCRSVLQQLKALCAVCSNRLYYSYIPAAARIDRRVRVQHQTATAIRATSRPVS